MSDNSQFEPESEDEDRKSRMSVQFVLDSEEEDKKSCESMSANIQLESESDVEDKEHHRSRVYEDKLKEQKMDIQDHPCVKDELSVYSTFHGYKIHKVYDEEKVVTGYRVVRQNKLRHRDNNGNNPKNENTRDIGTIVDKPYAGVKWDTEDIIEEFGDGLNKQYELLLFDNTLTGVTHTSVKCNGCEENPLRGIRWNCLSCANYNLCTECYMGDEHDVSHIFKRMISEHALGVQMVPREHLDFTFAYGILPNSNVQLRKKSNIKGINGSNKATVTGRVEHIIRKKTESARSSAIVQWIDYSEKRYYVGGKGQCDLKFKTAAKGPMYYETHLPFVTSETAKKGTRVVNCQRSDTIEQGCIGTIIEYTRDGHIVEKENSKKENKLDKRIITIQWDNGQPSKYPLPCRTIRLFDNGPAGVEHEGRFCCRCRTPTIPIWGIRWRCKKCKDYDLCNICYMSKKHRLRHTFERYLFPDKKSEDMPSRHQSKTSYVQSHGIFEGATVQLTNGRAQEEGKVRAICNSFEGTVRNNVEVKWLNKTVSINGILDLKCTKTKRPFPYYHSHLPVLRKDSRGYCEVNFNFDNGSAKKIQVDILRTVREVEKETFKPSLFLIFADHPELDGKNGQNGMMVLMEEVINFAKETSLPCYMVEQRVLFHSASTGTAFIHHETTKETIKQLVESGFSKFKRGNHDNKLKNEIEYFIRFAKYVIGEDVLPVIISLRNGGMTTRVLNIAAILTIPIIRFKKHSLDIIVFTLKKLNGRMIEVTKHKTDMQNPWNVKKSKSEIIALEKCNELHDQNEIVLLSEIELEFQHKLDGLVCCLIIGVSKEEGSFDESSGGSNIDVFPDALSMFLLKEGKWKIPKEQMKRPFNLQSIDYIYEKDMTSEIKKGLWSNLEYATSIAYKAHDFGAGKTLQLESSSSEMFGLIFCALLQKEYYAGAKQLIETGCVKIRHILLGCSILDDAANNWRTDQSLKEKLQRLKMSFTQRAIRITSCIYYADKKKEDEISKKKGDIIQTYYKDDTRKNNEHRELGDCINHAGRLLLSHGYLKTAIKTENKMFFDDNTVKNILNTMWYGTEQFDLRTILIFTGLAIFHLILLPLLMINMESRPLRWFYKQYKLPFMKVFLHTIGFLTLLIAYGYMLLFDYSEEGITRTDYFIISLMTSFFLDENKQHIVAIVRRKWKIYVTSWWNRLDWFSMIVYSCGMLLKLGESSNFRNASKVCLVAAFILLCIRILNLFCISSILGPKLVMIQQMFRDTFSFMIIMTVIMMCYNISYYALLYPNSEFSWEQMQKITRNGYWMLFGELNLDDDKVTEPDCTFNNTLYKTGAFQRCPTQLGLYLTPYVKAIYGLIAVILLLNLLIAMYSNTFQHVHQESEYYWSQLQNDFLEEYSVKTIFPLHLQLLVLPIAIVHAILWLNCPCGVILYDSCSRNKEGEELEEVNHRPMFVRVFLYNTNFDLKLKTTSEAEGNGALSAKGEIDFIEVDRMTIPQQNDRNDRRNEKIMKRLQTIDNRLNDIQEVLSKMAKLEDKNGEEDDVQTQYA